MHLLRELIYTETKLQSIAEKGVRYVPYLVRWGADADYLVDIHLIVL
jgi:hypothetical protein